MNNTYNLTIAKYACGFIEDGSLSALGNPATISKF